jgi:L-2-hydroxyglutarate oxidase LhgO
LIGGGVSGLACAKELLDGGEKDFILLEASDAVGISSLSINRGTINAKSYRPHVKFF